MIEYCRYSNAHTVSESLLEAQCLSVLLDGEDSELRKKGSSRLCMLHTVTARGVDLLCGRGHGAVLLQLFDGKTGKNSDRKLCC